MTKLPLYIPMAYHGKTPWRASQGIGKLNTTLRLRVMILIKKHKNEQTLTTTTLAGS